MAKGPETLAEAKSVAEEYQNAVQREIFYEQKKGNEYFKQGQNKQKGFQKNNQYSQNNQNLQSYQNLAHTQPQAQQTYARPQAAYQIPQQTPRINNNQPNHSRALEPDQSMRSRRSNVPMSGISYRSNAINNNEAEETDHAQVEEQGDNEEYFEDEINFQLSLGSAEET